MRNVKRIVLVAMAYTACVLVVLGILGVVRLSAKPNLEAKSDARYLVDRYTKAVTSWDKSVTMRIESETSIVQKDGEDEYTREWKYDVTHRRNGDRSEWLEYANFKTDERGGDAFSWEYKYILGNGFFLSYDRSDRDSGDGHRATMGSNTKETLFIKQMQGHDGGFLEGRMGGIGTAAKIAEALSASDDLHLVGEETIDGSLCSIVEANTKYGTFTLWLAPDKGYNSLKHVVNKKGRDILRDNIRIENQGITEWIEVVDSIEVRKINGVFVPVSGQSTLNVSSADGEEKRWHVKAKRSEIVLNPDFEAMGAFQIDLPDGTEVTHNDIPGIVFVWSNGKFVPDMDKYLIKSLTGKPLPEFEEISMDFDLYSARGKIILVCFWDMEQRPSRHCVRELARNAGQLKEKGVSIVAVQASRFDKDKLDKWVKDNNISFAVGMIEGEEEETKLNWGVKSLPWLILTDKDHIITADGFGIGELNEKIRKATGNAKH